MAVASESLQYTAKLVLVGDAGVKKVALMNRFAFGSTDNPSATYGPFLTKVVDIGAKKLTLEMWDTASDQRYRGLMAMYLRGTAAVIVVYDVTKADTFESVREWMEIADDSANDALKMLIGDKTRLSKAGKSREVSVDSGKAIADELAIPFFEVSSKTGENVDEAFMCIATRILESGEAQVVESESESSAGSKKKGKSLFSRIGGWLTASETTSSAAPKKSAEMDEKCDESSAESAEHLAKPKPSDEMAADKDDADMQRFAEWFAATFPKRFAPYLPLLCEEGFDSLDTFALVTESDLSAVIAKKGHMRLILQKANDLRHGSAVCDSEGAKPVGNGTAEHDEGEVLLF